MTTPLISIVLTTYNRCHLLSRAISSVLSGTYNNFELIIIDDASSDGTPEIVSQLKDPRIQYVRMPENGGVLRARNLGFDTARGDYITILDDDDELLPEAFSTVVTEFEGTAGKNVDVLWFDCQDVESGQKSGTMPMPAGRIDFEEYVCGRIHGDFWIVLKKEALNGNRFNENLKAHESLLWLRIHRTHKAHYVPKILCLKYREHGAERLCDLNVRLGQLTYTTLALSQFIEEFGDVLVRVCPTEYGKRLAYLGLHQLAVNDYTAGRSSILHSFKYRISIKYILLFVLSFIFHANHIKTIISKYQKLEGNLSR